MVLMTGTLSSDEMIDKRVTILSFSHSRIVLPGKSAMRSVFLRHLPVIAGFALLGGCAIGPDYVGPEDRRSGSLHGRGRRRRQASRARPGRRLVARLQRSHPGPDD
jgi:hypothetical protein